MKATLTTNKTFKKVIVALLAVMALFCFIASVTVYRLGKADATLSGVNFSDKYVVNTEIELPEGTVSVGGTNKKASPVIYLPDGSAYSAEKVTLSQKGKYTVEYAAEISGKTYTVQKSFIVNDYVYSNSVTGEGFSYVDNTGVKFDIRPGEKFNYNAIVDLNDNTKEDTLIKLDLLPAAVGTADVNMLYITLTDINDADNVVTICLKKGPNDGSAYASYITSGFGDEALLAHGVVEGANVIIKEPSSYGFEFTNSFAGKFDEVEQSAFDLRFDYDKKQLWAKDGDKLEMVCDYAKDFSEIWLGFTTGEAILSVWADKYVSADVSKPISGIVMDIDGVDLKAATATDGTSLPAEITKAPAPVVDFGSYGSAKNIPNAMVGYAYKLFDADVTSIYGNEKLSTRVYFGYNTSTRYEVSVINGRFTPDIEGVYSIVYRCEDAFGNVSETIVDVKAVANTLDAIEVTVPGYADHDECNVGNALELVPLSEVTVENNLGNYELSIIAKNAANNIVIEVEGDSFVANYGGEWEICYSAIDYVGRVGEFKYTANVIVGDTVDFVAGAIKDLGKYIIVNANNPVPTTEYIDYNVGPELVKVTKIYLEDGAGNKLVDAENGFITPTTAGEFKMVYEATSAKGITSTKKQDVIAVDVGYGDLSTFHLGKYFYSEDITEYTHNTKNVSFTVGANGTVDFIKPLNATNVNFSFLLSEKPDANDIVEITLTDVNNKDQVLKVEFFEGGLKARFNGKEAAAINAVLGGNLQCNISLKEGILTAGGASFIVGNFLNGDEFNGFDSMLVDMTIKLINKDTATKFTISEVGNQSFYRVAAGAGSWSDIDFRPPQMNSYGVPAGIILKGQTVTIGKAIYTDVIDPNGKGTLTVIMTTTAGDEVILSSDDGVKLENVETDREYEITLADTGKVTLKYSVTDGTASSTEERNLQVITREAPEIKLSGKVTSGTVGSTIKVATPTVAGMDLDITIFVRPPVGRMKSISGTSFKATMKGKYEISYFAIDVFGNLALESYYVNVA